MPLHAPSAPAAALRSVLTALRSPTAVRGTRTPAAVRLAQGTLRPELPLPIHEMARVGGTDGTPRTRLTGWRFQLRESTGEAEPAGESAAHGTAGGTDPGAPGRGMPVAAEAMLTPDGWAFAHFCEGPYVTSAERALQQAERLPDRYQPRLLSVPELYMLTLWLHHDTTADAAEGVPASSDLLIPLAPAPPGIAAHQPQRVDALLPQLTHRLPAAGPLLSVHA